MKTGENHLVEIKNERDFKKNSKSNAEVYASQENLLHSSLIRTHRLLQYSAI